MWSFHALLCTDHIVRDWKCACDESASCGHRDADGEIYESLVTNAIAIVSGNEYFVGMKICVSSFPLILAENRLKYGENGTVHLTFNYWGKIKIDRNFYDGRNFCQNFFEDHWDIDGAF